MVITKKQLQIFKKYWKDVKKLEENFYRGIGRFEEKMSKETGIPDIEIFFCDGEMVGIGNYDRTMKLIQRNQLE